MGSRDSPRKVPWTFLAHCGVIAIFVVALVVSKDLRDDLRERLGFPAPHPSTVGWAALFDPARELTSFDGTWLPHAPDEAGCTWSIASGRVDQRCKDAQATLTLRIAGPGVLVVRSGGGAKVYHYAKVGDRFYVGPSGAGMRLGSSVVFHDGQTRTVFQNGRCEAWRSVIVIGGEGPDWARDPQSIQCQLGDGRFDYQRIVFSLKRGDSGLRWAETSVEVAGDAVLDKELRRWPLLAAGTAEATDAGDAD